jgi:hypothetical protein
MLNESQLARFEARFCPEPNTGCWLWAPPHMKNGYGVIRFDGKQNYAHRISYEHHVGPIPDGLHIDHLCRTRCCVNPAHLEVVTQHENWRRGESQSAKNLRATHCARGHALSGNNLGRNKAGRRCLECARLDHLIGASRKYGRFRAECASLREPLLTAIRTGVHDFAELRLETSASRSHAVHTLRAMVNDGTLTRRSTKSYARYYISAKAAA